MDTVKHEAAHHHTKTHRKEDGKVIEKETAREHRRGGKSKGGKGGTQGKNGQRLNEITELPDEQWTERIMGTVVRSILAD